ncbi:MAG: hypothetical protein JSR33_11600 [Proteobacteria bacterium]|nr:hypothetical protein [Pseudomonadota bacterium]
MHPLAVVTEAIKKDLTLPQSLREIVLKNFVNEKPADENARTSEKKINNQPLASRERRTTLKQLAF